jgi:hypothetical protein
MLKQGACWLINSETLPKGRKGSASLAINPNPPIWASLDFQLRSTVAPFIFGFLKINLSRLSSQAPSIYSSLF